MSLEGLSNLLQADPGFAGALGAVTARCEAPGVTDHVAVTAPGGVWPVLLTAMAAKQAKLFKLAQGAPGGTAKGQASGPGQTNTQANAQENNQPNPQPRTGVTPPVVAITASTSAAEELAKAAKAFLPESQIAVLPAWETLPHERLSPRPDTLARRVAVFRRLAHPEPTGPNGAIKLLITPIRAVLQPVVADLGELPVVKLAAGDQADLDHLALQLVEAAYTRVDMVTRRGEFAVRGGIVDVFVPTDPHPVRVDFWGDQVEDIRYFSVTDQRSGDVVPDGLWAPACRELLLTDAVRERASSLLPRLPGLQDMLAKLAQGIPVEGMEALTPLLASAMTSVLAGLPQGSALVFLEPERLRRRAEDLATTDQEFLAAAWEAAAIGANSPIDLGGGSFLDLTELHHEAQTVGCGWWSIGTFGVTDDAATYQDFEVSAGEVPSFHGKVNRAVKQLKDWIKDGWRVVLTTEGHGPARRLVERLAGEGVPARLVEDLTGKLDMGVVHVTTAAGAGFVLADQRLAVVTERDLTGRGGTSTRDMRKMPARRKATVDPLQLRAGDLVVHERHGVGRFVELVSRTTGSGENQATREYLVLEYAASKRGGGSDRLYVPTDSLDQVTRYVGGESPALSKLGGTDWANTKTRARKAVKDIADELIRLYAQRMATQGHAFGADTPWQRELEDAFAYVETPDQLVTIDEVKADMERAVPMDRLICGDVGYGKTEVAVRAAFKAIQDGKQVAVLAPTTLLVQQHLETFRERCAPFPVNVKPLSRFQSAKDSAKTREGLASGAVDVVIGTHALITGDIHFKDLGLVIVDEEQRFGVEHKETLKAVRPNVDVLSMSATPIPRTLEMAVSGIREMSTLTTPPEDRQPVLTYVGPATPGQTAAAIRRELLRDGQIFYVHNRVRSITSTAAKLAEWVPEARIAVAHGQMNEHQLEQIIIDFWERRIDVLVCTTIIETGLDIANANTLIVDNADKFGLSQLHQLRGRVGRGKERAYSYFMYPPDTALTETAHDRLSTIASQSELGAGMQVALKDLEIRGAGSLLGGQQSGHIAGVGFDLYLRMIAEAVAESKGEADPIPEEVTVELSVDAHLPVEYIDGERLRLEAYTKIAQSLNSAELAVVRDELEDRYGPIPAPAEALFQVAKLRQVARGAGISEINAQGKYVRLHPVTMTESQQLWLQRVCRGTIYKPATRVVLVPVPRPAQLGEPPLSGADLVTWLVQLIKDLVARIPAPVG